MNNDKDPKNDEIITSQSLHEQVNAERKREGKNSIPAVNSFAGTTSNNLARRDKSWSSVPDFFVKLAKGAGKEEKQAPEKEKTDHE